MKQIQYILLTLAAIFLVACQADEDALNDKGFLSFAIGQDVSVTTKAEEYNPELLALKVSDSTGKEVKTATGSVTELNALKYELKAGEYKIEVYSNNYDGNSAFGENGAYYYGSTNVTIAKGDNKTATITCSLANVKVTVKFDSKLVSDLGEKGSISTQVSGATGSATARDFSPNSGNSIAFFPVSDLNVQIKVVGSDGSTANTMTHKITEVKARDHYILNIKLQETGTENITVQVDPSMQEYSYEFVVSQKATNQASLSANPWAKFAYLTAENVTSASGIDLSTLKIQYRQKDTENWTTAETTVADNTYSATATDLTPATTYEYRLTDGLETPAFNISGGEFTTEEAIVLQNGSFEEWSTIETDGLFTKRQSAYPNASASVNFWDTSNAGANYMSVKNPTQSATDDVHSPGKAAKLTSVVNGAFAAASLYTGTFGSIDFSSFGATLTFGQSFSARPIILKGFYKYKPVNVDNVGNNLPADATVSKGNPDQCSIYIALAKKSYLINNKDESTFIKFADDPNIIAYGELPSGAATEGDDYVEFNIPLKYKKESFDEKPTHIIIVCSASKYGDYMTGGEGSTLFLDDFELVYDGEPAIWEQ